MFRHFYDLDNLEAVDVALDENVSFLSRFHNSLQRDLTEAEEDQIQKIFLYNMAYAFPLTRNLVENEYSFQQFTTIFTNQNTNTVGNSIQRHNLEKYLRKLANLNLDFDDIRIDFTSMKQQDIPKTMLLSLIKDAFMIFGLLKNSKVNLHHPTLNLNFNKFFFDFVHIQDLITIFGECFCTATALNIAITVSDHFNGQSFLLALKEIFKSMPYLTSISLLLEHLNNLTEDTTIMIVNHLFAQNLKKIALDFSSTTTTSRIALNHTTQVVKNSNQLAPKEIEISFPTLWRFPLEDTRDFFLAMNRSSPNLQSMIYSSANNQPFTKNILQDLCQKPISDLEKIEYIDIEFTQGCNIEESDMLCFLKKLMVCRRADLNLIFSFNNCKAATDSTISALEKWFPSTHSQVYYIELNFVDCHLISDKTLKFFGDRVLIGNNGARLTFENCSKISDDGLGYLSNALIANKTMFTPVDDMDRHVSLEFYNCESVSEIGVENLKDKVKKSGFPSGKLKVNGQAILQNE